MSHWNLEKVIGEGGMGLVFAARRGEQCAALKFLRQPLDLATQQFFFDEAKLLAQLNHPNLVKILDFIPSEAVLRQIHVLPELNHQVPAGSPCVVMELLNGKRLDQVAGTWGERDWVAALIQIGEGLQYLHRRKILHRDLKPANLFVEATGRLKLLDFGLSLPLKDGVERDLRLGTFPYMAPEVFAGFPGYSSDLFALGVTCYALMTQKFPFGKPLAGEFLASRPVPQPLKKSRPDLPDYLCDLVHRLLVLKPSDRFASASTLLNYLRHHSELGLKIISSDSREQTLLRPPLIGRSEELDRLERDLLRQATSQVVVSLLRGPTGCGRSRVIEEFRWRVLFAQGIYMTISPSDSEQSILLLNRLFKISDGENIGLDPFAWAEKINSFTGSTRHVLVLEDFHAWAATSQEFFISLACLLVSSQVAFSLLFELNDDWLNPEVIEKLQPLYRVASEVRLPDFNESEIQAFIQSVGVEARISPELQKLLIKTRIARPLLLLEGLKHLQGKSSLLNDPQTELQMPRSMEEVLVNQVRGLTPDSRRIFALIALAPIPLEIEALTQIFNFDALKVAQTLLNLDQLGLLRSRDIAHPYLGLAHSVSYFEWNKIFTNDDFIWAKKQWLQTLVSMQQEKSEDYTVAIAEAAVSLGLASEYEEIILTAFSHLDANGEGRRVLRWVTEIIDTPISDTYRSKLFAHQAPILFRLARYEEALQAYQNWYRFRKDDESKLQLVKFYFYTGFVYFAWGKDEEAVEHFLKCLTASDPHAYPEIKVYLVRALNRLSAIKEKQSKWDEGAQLLERALQLCPQDPSLIGETEQRFGELELARNRLDRAEQHQLATLNYYQSLQNPGAMAIACNALGVTLREQGRLSEARDYLEQSIVFAKQARAVAGMARYLGNLALLQVDQGDWHSGLQNIEESTKLLAIVGSDAERAIAELQSAQIYLQIGNLGRGESLLQQLKQKQPLLRQLSLWVSVFMMKGEAALRCGDFNQAKKIFTLLGDAPQMCPRDRLRLALAELRLKLLAGSEAEPAQLRAWGEYFQKFLFPNYQAWAKIITILTGSLSEGDLSKLLSWIENMPEIEAPELRLELTAILIRYCCRKDLPRLLARLEQCRSKVWNQLHQNLPQEFQMDFEKNRGLRDLEEQLDVDIEVPTPLVTASVPNPFQPGAISEVRFKQFCEIAVQISQRRNLEDILDRVMDASILLAGAERGFLILKNDAVEGGPFPGFEVKAARHFNHKTISEAGFQFSLSMVKQALSDASPVITDNAQQDERFQNIQSVHLYQLKSILVVPLEVGGEVLGVLYLDHRYKPDCFSKEDVLVIMAFATQASLAIERARMLSQLELNRDELKSQVQVQAQKIEELAEELEYSRDHLKHSYHEIVGNSPPMIEVFKLLDHVTKTRIPVWIWGESGTGKELIARALHFNSPRSDKPFVTENCSSIPENLLESELFGHKRGAFTHADRDRVGLFEQANGGTLFLDEVADMSLPMQVKLLRVLQEGEVRHLGSNKKVKIDVRLVTASNQDLAVLVREGKFRQDLFFRINGMTIALPPLRNRKPDIPALVHYMIKNISAANDLKPSKVSKEALKFFYDYDWPGNIRELEGFVRNLLLFSDGQPITREFVEYHKKMLERQSTVSQGKNSSVVIAAVNEEDQMEHKQLVDSLRKHRMDKYAVAKELGISVKTVYARMGKFKIPKKNSLLMTYLENL